MEILRGKLYLSDIRKDTVQTDGKGKYIWVDVVKRRTVGKYGDTHSITHWDRGTTQYLASLRPQTIDTGRQQQTDAPAPTADDMPEDIF